MGCKDVGCELLSQQLLPEKVKGEQEWMPPDSQWVIQSWNHRLFSLSTGKDRPLFSHTTYWDKSPTLNYIRQLVVTGYNYILMCLVYQTLTLFAVYPSSFFRSKTWFYYGHTIILDFQISLRNVWTAQELL